MFEKNAKLARQCGMPSNYMVDVIDGQLVWRKPINARMGAYEYLIQRPDGTTARAPMMPSPDGPR